MKKQILTIEENHKDVKVLGECLYSKGFRYDTQWRFKNGEIIKSENPEIRSSSSSNGKISREGNYIRITNLKYWSNYDRKILLEALALANQSTKEYTFQFGNIDNYEMEYGGDRDYPASFTFYSHKKKK